jgi:ABC-type sulfate transport system permease component
VVKYSKFRLISEIVCVVGFLGLVTAWILKRYGFDMSVVRMVFLIALAPFLTGVVLTSVAELRRRSR